MSNLNNLITRVSQTPHETAPELIRAVELHFGPLTIDLAATADDTKAPRYITPERDSLTCDWCSEIGDGIGWLNPVVGDIAPWVNKCAHVTVSGSRILLLCQHATDSDWYWQDVLPHASVHVLVPRMTYEGIPMPLIIAAYNMGEIGTVCRWWWEREEQYHG